MGLNAMGQKSSIKSAKVASPGKLAAAKAACNIRFRATLLRPKATAKGTGKAVSWSFLILPKAASAQLPSRSMVSVHGMFDGVAFQATLEPDGQGGHWLKVDRALREAAGAEAGDVVRLEIAPVAEEPEPRVPADLRKALASAQPGARKVWSDITPLARRDWIHWIVSARQAETRASDPNDLRHARQRQATPVLLRSLRDVCQEPQLPRSRRLVEVTRGAREEFCLRASQRKVGRFLRSWLSGVARGRQPGSEHGVDSA
jgi:hypothetical protein